MLALLTWCTADPLDQEEICIVETRQLVYLVALNLLLTESLSTSEVSSKEVFFAKLLSHLEALTPFLISRLTFKASGTQEISLSGDFNYFCQPFPHCGGLNKNGPHGLTYLMAWSPGSGSI